MRISGIAYFVVVWFLLGAMSCDSQTNSPASVEQKAAAQETVPPTQGKNTGVTIPKTPGSQKIAPNMLSSQQAMDILLKERDHYWQNARKIVHRSVREILAQHEDELENGLKYSKLISGDSSKKQIALTFDDGPHPNYTPRLLQILTKYRIPTTFFVVGEQAEAHPDLIRQQAAAGHVIANHTYHHVSLPKIPEEFVADEIKACGEVIQTITGKPAHYFRPPGGEYTPQVAEVSEALGYTMVLWTDDPGDYARPGDDLIIERTLRKANSGGILLLHDGVEETIEVLPAIIEALQSKGYEFVPLSQLQKRGKG